VVYHPFWSIYHPCWSIYHWLGRKNWRLWVRRKALSMHWCIWKYEDWRRV
jgi:hypothetical protein